MGLALYLHFYDLLALNVTQFLSGLHFHLGKLIAYKNKLLLLRRYFQQVADKKKEQEGTKISNMLCYTLFRIITEN